MTPWSLVLGHDEITPGAVLRPDNARKFVSFYFTFGEFGDIAIRQELAWFHLAVLRSSVVDKVAGGMSCVLRCVLRALVVDAGSFTVGVVLPLEDGPTLLFAQVRNHLGDESALSRGLAAKGASGIRPCIKCANVVKKNSDLAPRRAGLVEITCTSPESFVVVSDHELWASYDRLAATQATASQAAFEKHQKAAGISVNDQGVLADKALRGHFRPIESLTYDWQHTFLSNGVASQELFCFLGAGRQHGVRDIWSLLEQFCAANWSFPLQHRAEGQVIHKVFNKTRERSSQDHFKSGASELLCVYPLVRRFAEGVLLPRIPALAGQVRSLLLCCRVLDLLQDCKGGVADINKVERAILDYLCAHRAVYGDQDWRPKFHYALHIPEQLRRDARLYDCFVVERSHQLPKDLAASVKNTGNFEKSVIARSLLVRLRRLEEWVVKSALQGPTKEFPELARLTGEPELRMASKCVLSGFVFAAGDIMLCDDYAIAFEAAVQGAGRLGVLGRLLDIVARPSATTAECELQGGLSLLWTSDLRARRPHAWTSLASGRTLLLLPDLGGTP